MRPTTHGRRDPGGTEARGEPGREDGERPKAGPALGRQEPTRDASKARQMSLTRATWPARSRRSRSGGGSPAWLRGLDGSSRDILIPAGRGRHGRSGCPPRLRDASGAQRDREGRGGTGRSGRGANALPLFPMQLETRSNAAAGRRRRRRKAASGEPDAAGGDREAGTGNAAN